MHRAPTSYVQTVARNSLLSELLTFYIPRAATHGTLLLGTGYTWHIWVKYSSCPITLWALSRVSHFASFLSSATPVVRSTLLSPVARFIWVPVFRLPFDIRLCPRLRLRPLRYRLSLRQLWAYFCDRSRLRPLLIFRPWHFINPLTCVITAASPASAQAYTSPMLAACQGQL